MQCVIGTPKAEERDWAEAIFEQIIDGNFQNIDERHQAKDSKVTTNSKQVS